MLWRRKTVTERQLPPKSNWGWSKQNNGWIPKWMEVSAIAECGKEIKNVVVKRQIV